MKRFLVQASYFVGLILLIQIFLIQGTAFGKKKQTSEVVQTPKAMIAALNQRHVAIDQRENRVKEREAQLKLLKDEILAMLEDHKKKATDYKKMVDDYKKLQETVSKKEADRVNDQEKEEQARLDLLVKIYQSMKPKEAASRISKLKESTGAKILRRIKPKISAAILGKMNVEKAARYTEIFITGDK